MMFPPDSAYSRLYILSSLISQPSYVKNGSLATVINDIDVLYCYLIFVRCIRLMFISSDLVIKFF